MRQDNKKENNLSYTNKKEKVFDKLLCENPSP